MKIIIAEEELPDNIDLDMIHDRLDELASMYGSLKTQIEVLQDWFGLLDETTEGQKNG